MNDLWVYVARSDSPGSFQRWEDMTDIDPDNQVKTPSPRGGAATWYKNDDEPVLYLFGGFGPETTRGTPMGKGTDAVLADGEQAKTTTFNDMWEFNLADDTPDRAPWKRVLPAGENTASRTRTWKTHV